VGEPGRGEEPFPPAFEAEVVLQDEPDHLATHAIAANGVEAVSVKTR